MDVSSEAVVSYLPFTVRRVARWVDCDPAGVVFTGKFTDYLLGAVMHFLRHIGYGPSDREGREQGVGLPCQHMSLTFHMPLYPEDTVDIRIEVGEIRKRTFDLIARACFADGRMAFEGKVSLIAIRLDVRKSLDLPNALREKLQSYLLVRTSHHQA
ncbi:MAG: acyl-CoA thioesterase [Pseudomonadota bacterium]